jgi:hypothetical protein
MRHRLVIVWERFAGYDIAIVSLERDESSFRGEFYRLYIL